MINHTADTAGKKKAYMIDQGLHYPYASEAAVDYASSETSNENSKIAASVKKLREAWDVESGRQNFSTRAYCYACASV